MWLSLTLRVAQSWLAKGLQSGACRSPRRSKASQDGPPPQLPIGGEEDPAHGTSRPSIVDLVPDSSLGRWGSENLGVLSKGGELGLKVGSLRLVQARTDLADEG